MHSLFCAALMIAAALLAAFSQILLKKSTLEKHDNFVRNYLNAKVIAAYSIFTVTVFINIYAYTGIDYKLGAVLGSTAYVFTMLLSKLLLKDKLTWGCIAGNCFIVIGIGIYVSNAF